MREAQFSLHAAIEDRHWWFTGRRAIVKRLVGRVVGPREGAVLIDVGCGTGANAAAFTERFRCYGFDESDRALELARSRFPSIEFARETDFAKRAELFASADVVLLLDVLEHVPDDFAFASALFALARPGAHFVITVPADRALWSKHDESFGHFRRYDAERLAALWGGLALEPRLLSHFNARLYPIIRGVRSLTRRRERTAGASGTDFSELPSLVNRALERCFAGEGAKLERALDRPNASAYSRGASLIAILRRGRGAIETRRRPNDIAPDERRAPLQA